MQGPLILDRYRPIEVSGEGGSGIVQICWDTSLQRRVAIKSMSLYGSAEGSVPGLAEARTGAMLKHPCIVDVIDFAVEGGEAYLIMEAVEGISLPKLMARTRPGEFDLDILAAIVDCCADALEFAHENQVLHLDIKPENILIDRSGRVKVSDFGISELSSAQGYGQALGGTIGYMPPEQINGENLDQRSDVFAFAMVVYELFCGYNPYLVQDLNDSLERMRRHAIKAPSRARDDVNPSIDSVFARAISPEREHRTRSVGEFADELLPFLGDPNEGIAKLHQLSCSEEPDDERYLAREEADGVWDRIPDTVRTIVGRGGAAIMSWWVAAVGVVAFNALSLPISLAIALIAGAIGAAAPGVGALVAIATLGAGIIYNPATPAWLGATLIIIAVCWWLVAGRIETASANATLATAPLGLIGFTPLTPLVTGFNLTFGRSIITALMQVVLALSLGIATGSGSMLKFNLWVIAPEQAVDFYALLTAPSTWAFAVTWVIAAALMSAFCSRAKRMWAIIGGVFSTALLFGGQVAAGWVVSRTFDIPANEWIIPIVLAGALICVIGALGAPYRESKEVD